MSFACFCVHLAILDQGRGHVVTIWIIFCWFWLLHYQFIRFLGSMWPVLQPSIQSIYKRSAAKLSLRPAWKAQIGTVTGILRTMTGKKTWEKQFRKTEKIEKSKCCIFWCVKICCETSWWKEWMGGCSTDTEISLAETCGVALVSATLSASNQAVEGSPLMFGSSDKKSLIWCELLMWRSLLMRLDWCLAPTTGMNFKFPEFHRMNIMNQFWLRKCHFFHARLCTSLDGGNLTGDTGLYIYAPWPRLEATLKQCMSLAWILLCAAVLRRSMHFNLQNWYKSICVPLLDHNGHDFIFPFFQGHWRGRHRSTLYRGAWSFFAKSRVFWWMFGSFERNHVGQGSNVI